MAPHRHFAHHAIVLPGITISDTNTTSTVIDYREYENGVVHDPGGAATVTFEVSTESDGTFVGLVLIGGGAVTVTVADNKAFALPADLAGARFFRMVAGTTETTTAIVSLKS